MILRIAFLGERAESAPAAGTAGENGKQKVQPYTVCFVSTFFS